jgi:sirohydrochlorin ferrochelatase
VLPYFLAAGRHVIRDISDQVERKRGEHGGVEMQILPCPGQAPGMTDLLLTLLDADTTGH